MYQKALKKASEVGASKATGDALLAQTCKMLSMCHAVNPEMLYNGAKKRKIDSRSLVKLAHEDIGAFAFLPFA